MLALTNDLATSQVYVDALSNAINLIKKNGAESGQLNTQVSFLGGSDKPEKGYYLVKFYNHKKIKVMFFNGEHFEKFKSDEFIHDEIERYNKLTINGVG